MKELTFMENFDSHRYCDRKLQALTEGGIEVDQKILQVLSGRPGRVARHDSVFRKYINRW